MREITRTVRQWHALGRPYALATVVAVDGSAPREIGAALAVDEAGTAAGSVSGGCVDAEVYELCREALRTGEPVRRSFESDPDDPFAPALTCGGRIEVLIRRIDPGGRDAIPAGLDPDPADAPRLLVFGAVEVAAALTRVGSMLGYRVTVCDARPVFATRERFPGADEVVIDWPHRYFATAEVGPRTAVCVLTHDTRFDIPVLLAALRSPAGYVGAIGSRRTCGQRAERLRAAGLTEAELSRLRAPIGLDLGGETPEEVALAIGAEILALARGRGAQPLRDTAGPLHHRVARETPTPWKGAMISCP